MHQSNGTARQQTRGNARVGGRLDTGETAMLAINHSCDDAEATNQITPHRLQQGVQLQATVLYLVMAPSYKSVGRRFNSPRGHWIFQLT
jgi:hypothetical protein